MLRTAHYHDALVAERTVPRVAGASPGTASKERARPSTSRPKRPPKDPAPAGRSGETISTPTHHTRIIAVANQKGGVGKSTTAVSLGAALAELGLRVLVVDLDPQGNASTGLGIRHEARDITVYDVLAAEAPIEGAIVPTPVENLSAIPSTIDLAGAEIELVSQFSRELRLRRALEPLQDGEYDFILLDCPPSLGLLTVNALAAAEELIVPIQCEYYALEGLGQLLRNVRLVQQNVNPQLRLTGIVMTMFDPRTKLSEQVVAEVRRFFGTRVYDTIIPRTVRLSEAPGFGQPITVYDPRSRGAQRYRDLAREVVVKLPEEGPLPVIDELPSVILPPPEPEPARAPVPLTAEGEDLEERSDLPEAEVTSAVEGAEDGEPIPAGPVLMDVDSTARTDEDESDVAEPVFRGPITLGELEVEPSDPEAGPEGLADRNGEPSPRGASDVEAERSSSSAVTGHPAPDSTETEAGVERPVEETTVTVESERASSPSDAASEEEPETRRRWGLFRRGGSR
jgi:chromosome partitioning protein